MPDTRATAPSPAVRIVSPRRTLVALIFACALFTAMGVVVYALGPTKTLNTVVGIAAIGFFGVGGGYALLGQWRRSVVLRADADGIRLGSGGSIPWRDVDRIGANASAFGIRLRRYETLLATTRPSTHTAQSLRASRARDGWDLVWDARLLDRAPALAARDLEACRPDV